MGVSADDIADAVLKQFDKLPGKGKPLHRTGGVREWVPLCGIVAQGRESLVCLAVATGMKCLPQSKVAQAQGIILHDWHAEILAIRSFNRFLLDECYSLASAQRGASDFIRLRSLDERTNVNSQPFTLKDDIALHMYCSEAPCGDASMELTMAAQDDATPWDLSSIATHSNSGTHSSPLISEPQLHGRGYFSALGVVRRKPSRPDAPPTLSKSCSDKIALKQCTSLLSSIASLIIAPSNAYLTSLVLPSSQYSPAGCTRAFSASGRLKELAGKDWENGYSFNPFEIRITSREFRYCRKQIISAGDRLVPSNISASWTPNHFETLIGGVLQGRKQGDSRGASRVCRSSIWKIALEISGLANAPQAEGCLKKEKYMDLKTDDLLAERETVKENAKHTSLEGWIKNTGDEEFCLESYEQ